MFSLSIYKIYELIWKDLKALSIYIFDRWRKTVATKKFQKQAELYISRFWQLIQRDRPIVYAWLPSMYSYARWARTPTKDSRV